MGVIIIIALFASIIFYITIGVVLGFRAKSVADVLPISSKTMAEVKSTSEFSTSTVATTISLATVVLAFFELAEKFGLWLFWAVITTSAGLLFVRLFAKRILKRISTYDHRPTLNEFLGREFNSKTVCFVSAVCTSLGFLSAFALELIVGSVFVGWLIPDWPPLTILIILSGLVFIYTAVGGFRAVIISDRIQMISIWLFLILLSGFYAYFVLKNGGLAKGMEKIPAGVFSLSYRQGLISFLFGIFIMNVPTFLSDIGIWQRITGSQQDYIVLKGLLRGAVSAAISWSLIILLACFAFLLIVKKENTNPLILVIQTVSAEKNAFAAIVLFCVTFGLYGAMLSTASTQLIAVSHTLYEDVLSNIRRQTLKDRIASPKELNLSRLILLVSAALSIIVIYILWQKKGFTIADLVFAIYGAQVGLCPLVIMTLLVKTQRLAGLARWATAAIIASFFTGWGSAIFGKINAMDNLVYLSPVISLIISTIIICTGFFVDSRKQTGQ